MVNRIIITCFIIVCIITLAVLAWLFINSNNDGRNTADGSVYVKICDEGRLVWETE